VLRSSNLVLIMPDDLDSALQRHFGFEEFRPGQREVIEALLAGNSAAAVFPTGSGKSLCYQLPALLLEGVTLVVSPLIALMKDQIDALETRGVAARRLDSTLSADEYARVMQEVRAGELRLLYVAPERFNNERFREAIPQIRVALFAIDEAHCISEWGHNFRPDYLKLARFAETCGAERVLALTATATEAVLEDIRREFKIEPQNAVRTGFYRPNLTLVTTPASPRERDGLLIDRLRQRERGPTIVYVTLQKTAEDVAGRLSAAGFAACAYHAGMKDEERAQVQDWFLASDSGIVAATIAFGMGIDKSNIRYVYHYNLPKSLENYSQEIGRAGRDGATSICETFVCLDDLNTLENFDYGDTPTLAAVQQLVRKIFSLGEEFDVSYYELSAECDIRILVVRTLITYLEQMNYLEGGTPFYSEYKFQPLVSSKEILAKFDGERREFLAGVLRQSRKAKTWFWIDVDRAADALRQPGELIIRALDYLGEQRLLELQAAGVRNRYKRLNAPRDYDGLCRHLHESTQKREAREIARLGQVIELASLDGCQTAALCAHFGETRSEPCGHCSWCTSGRIPAAIPIRPRHELDETTLRRALALRREFPDILHEPESLARLLCGLTSPRLTKAKLTSHALFGAASQVSYPDVLKRIANGE
jgi:ATP-dependent DNA helicase RecQ